jgi:hypothetical protein
VFVGEVIVVVGILALSRQMADTPVESKAKLDLVGTAALGARPRHVRVRRPALQRVGLAQARPDQPSLGSISMTFWLMGAGLLVVWLFLLWETRLVRQGREPLVNPQMLRNRQLNGGLLMFFFQFLLQAGIFFVIPLYLSVDLALSAMATGVRLMPLSIALLISALGVPRLWPTASPRRVVRIGILLMLAGILSLLSGITIDSGAAVVTVPMLLVGLGIGALASQLGAVTVSSVPTEQSGEVGGLQNTATNLGASIGTALAGSMLISILTASLIAGIRDNPQVPESVKSQATVQLSSGVPFLSDGDHGAARRRVADVHRAHPGPPARGRRRTRTGRGRRRPVGRHRPREWWSDPAVRPSGSTGTGWSGSGRRRAGSCSR